MATQRLASATWNSGDLANWSKLLADDVEVYYGSMGVPLTRAQGVAVNEMYYAAFPDTDLTATRIVSMGDGWVLNEAVITSTHLGPYVGIPADVSAASACMGVNQGVGATVTMAEAPHVPRVVAALEGVGVAVDYEELPGDHLTTLRQQLVLSLEFLSGRLLGAARTVRSGSSSHCGRT